MAILQAVIIGLIALILVPGFSFYFDVTPKLIVLLAGTAAVLVWFGTCLRIAPKRFSVVVILTVISLAASSAASGNPSLSVYGTIWRRFGALPQTVTLLFVWVLAAHTAGRPDRVRTVLRGITISGFIGATYGICQYAGFDPLLNPASYHVGEGIWTIVRPPGTLGYVSYFASWLVCVAFLSVALAKMESVAWWRRFSYASGAVSLIALILTGTRAGLVAVLAGAIVGLSKSLPIRVSRRLVVVTCTALILVAGFWFSPGGWLLHSRMRWFAEDPWGGARLLLWRDSLRMAIHHPVLGSGPETFQSTFPRYESDSLAKAYPDFTHESAHNIFLDAFTAQGVPGLILLIFLCILGMRRSQPWLTAAIVAALVCQQFIVFNLPAAVVFYSAIALSVALASPEAPRVRLGYPAIACAIAAVCLIWLAIRFGAADRYLALSRRALESGNLAAAESGYSAFERLQPGKTAADLWYSRSLLAFAGRATDPPGRFRALMLSAAAAARATKTAEDPFNAWFQLAIVSASQNNLESTEKALRSAIAAHPVWFKPHWTLAQLMLMRGRYAEAEREASLAAYLDNGKHPEVLQTLTSIRAAQAATPAALQK